MGNVLVVVEQAQGQVRTASLPAVTFGVKMAEAAGGKLTLLVIGTGAEKAAQEASKLGAADVVAVEDAKLEHYLAETYAPVVAKIAKEKGATVIGATGTSFGKDLMPRVAGVMDAAMVADVIGVEGANKFKRPMMAGNVIEHVEVSSPTIVVTVRQTEFPPAQAGANAAPVAKGDPGPIDARGAVFVSLSEAKSDRPELTEAKIVVSGGRGMREGKNFEQVAALADLLGGAMGASRAACDAGMVPNDLQVGQTGKVVAPNLYIAVAISGAIQHLAGMKGSKVIVAINKDAEAPIFSISDLGIVGDVHKVLPQLIEALQARS